VKQKVRIAAGQGFWGDLPEAPVRQVEGGPIDYLMLDYLAEVTMSIMQKQRSRDPGAGYARDFVPLMKQILPACIERNIRVTANAGGVNVAGCAAAVKDVALELGLGGKVRLGLVSGDDIMAKLDELLARGIELRNMDNGAPLSTVRDRIQSANVYLGAAPMLEALNRGAQIVITGRATDTGLTLAPLMHEFGWSADDWNKIAAGTIAGHIIECGAQCSGGNCQFEWRSVPNLADVGFPIVEAAPDGTFVITKHEGTGGWVTIPSVKEQLVYEMGDPHEYITPDCIADFTTIQLGYEGRDRVRVSGAYQHRTRRQLRRPQSRTGWSATCAARPTTWPAGRQSLGSSGIGPRPPDSGGGPPTTRRRIRSTPGGPPRPPTGAVAAHARRSPTRRPV
jgi:hypothetical protein